MIEKVLTLKKNDHQDMVVEIAMRWTKVLRTGGLGVRFMAVDRSTVMFNIQNGKEVTEVMIKKCWEVY